MSLHPGTRLGPYEIIGLLGVGGMGEVYRAHDPRLGRDVAVKVLPSAVDSDPDHLARFEREARTVAGLNHPNIVMLHSIEEHGGVCLLTMELVEGQSLEHLVASGGLPLRRLLDLAIPLADALVAAHARGVIHRDLKPANVMVTREGRVKVLDFGLAKRAPVDPNPTQAATIETSMIASGSVAGTVPYMAPEQIRGGEADARTDMFAFGILLYELATGKQPFTGTTFADLASSILKDTPESLAIARADLPVDLDRIVSRCLEKSPRDRFQTAVDLYSELRMLQQTVEQGSPTQPPAPAKAADPVVASIAVLPFLNRSQSVEDEYFSDGLADELLNVLAKIRGLRVAARTSSSLFKGTTDDLATIGRKLNVATLLEGSVRKAGNRVRISVQLVKISDGYPLWSETYDRMLDDIFAVQDDIAQSVVKELRTTLLGETPNSDANVQVKADVARAMRGRGENPEAQRLYLQARYFIDRNTPEDSAKGIEHIKEALKLDPGYAIAWAELGSAYAREAGSGWVSVEEGYRSARTAVDRALLLEPDLAEGHAQRGWILATYDWDWRGADASLRRAVELAPGSASVLRSAGILAWCFGRIDEVLELLRRAVDLDPLSARYYNNLGHACHAAGQVAEAEEAFRTALELAPEGIGSRALLAMLLEDRGRSEEAMKEAIQEPDEGFRLQALAVLHHAAGRMAESDEMLRDLTAKYAEDSAYQIAEVHAARAEADRAFEWLERAYAQRDGGLTDMRASPRFRPLHDDPRWEALLKKMGFDG